MRKLLLLAVVAATPAAADHTEFYLTAGAGKVSLFQPQRESAFRPFFALEARQPMHVGKRQRLELFGGIIQFGGSIQESSVNRLQGYYGARFHLSPSLFVTAAHYSDHSVIGGAPFLGAPFVTSGNFFSITTRLN